VPGRRAGTVGARVDFGFGASVEITATGADSARGWRFAQNPDVRARSATWISDVSRRARGRRGAGSGGGGAAF